MTQTLDFQRVNKTWIIGGAIGLAGLVLILWLLGAFGNSAEALANSPKASDRRKAVEKLADRGTEKASRILSNLAGDPDPLTARMAVSALGDVRNEVNLKALTEILASKKVSPAARGEAAATIGKFKQADTTQLTETLANDSDAQVRAGAAKGLARLQKHGTIPQLFAALKDPDPAVRRWAITGIHNMIVRRFPYDADKAPASQEAVINQIGEYLRQCKVL